MTTLSDHAESIVEDTGATGAVVVTTDGDESDIGGHFSESVEQHPGELALWMLALHIDHVTRTARGAGGDATHVDVARDALEMLQASYAEGRE